jgi:hypothetical protein
LTNTLSVYLLSVVNTPFHPSVYPSVFQDLCLFICLSTVYPPLDPCVCQTLCLSICLFAVYPPFHPTVCQTLCLSLGLSAVYLPLHSIVCQTLCQSVCLNGMVSYCKIGRQTGRPAVSLAGRQGETSCFLGPTSNYGRAHSFSSEHTGNFITR